MGVSRRAVLMGIGGLGAAGAALALGGGLRANADGGAPSGEVRRISGAETVQRAREKEAVLLDVRSRSAYDMQHAEGAVHIPLGELDGRWGELPKDKLIAAYCT